MSYYWFIFCKTDLMLEKTSDGSHTIPYGEEPPVSVKEWTTIHTIDIPEPILPGNGDTKAKTLRIDSPITDHPSYEMIGLRASNQIYLHSRESQIQNSAEYAVRQ